MKKKKIMAVLSTPELLKSLISWFLKVPCLSTSCIFKTLNFCVLAAQTCVNMPQAIKSFKFKITLFVPEGQLKAHWAVEQGHNGQLTSVQTSLKLSRTYKVLINYVIIYVII